MNKAIGQVLSYLISQNGLYQKDVGEVMKVNGGTLTKIIRGEKELSFLMGLRFLDPELSIDAFLSLLSKEEINRKDLSTLKWLNKNEQRKPNQNLD